MKNNLSSYFIIFYYCCCVVYYVVQYYFFISSIIMCCCWRSGQCFFISIPSRRATEPIQPRDRRSGLWGAIATFWPSNGIKFGNCTGVFSHRSPRWQILRNPRKAWRGHVQRCLSCKVYGGSSQWEQQPSKKPEARHE